MTWSLLLPAAATVITLTVLTMSLQRVRHELTELRLSLRRSRAAAVATDELERRTIIVAARAADIDAGARRRLHHRRSRRRTAHR